MEVYGSTSRGVCVCVCDGRRRRRGAITWPRADAGCIRNTSDTQQLTKIRASGCEDVEKRPPRTFMTRPPQSIRSTKLWCHLSQLNASRFHTLLFCYRHLIWPRLSLPLSLSLSFSLFLSLSGERMNNVLQSSAPPSLPYAPQTCRVSDIRCVCTIGAQWPPAAGGEVRNPLQSPRLLPFGATSL